ncbi:CRISPR-associated endonuclease Cas2 [bacterium]|nr:CRISPR-associated endonuclease Cas2 [candidate division CSSED10-310 bacterium]
MRRCYIVSYDIANDKRLRKVADVMKAYGTRIQFSVFRCELTAMKRARLEQALSAEMNLGKDQVLFIDLGPVPGRGDECVTSLGRKYIEPEHGQIVY